MRLRDLLSDLWKRGTLPFPAKRATLLCMRLDDMLVVHPEQIETPCSRCNHICAVYPSGQAIMAKMKTEIVCNVCATESERGSPLAPGAQAESFQSHRKP
jgi:hypothetical protein